MCVCSAATFSNKVVHADAQRVFCSLSSVPGRSAGSVSGYLRPFAGDVAFSFLKYVKEESDGSLAWTQLSLRMCAQ